jgi:hypothetical protein
MSPCPLQRRREGYLRYKQTKAGPRITLPQGQGDSTPSPHGASSYTLTPRPMTMPRPESSIIKIETPDQSEARDDARWRNEVPHYHQMRLLHCACQHGVASAYDCPDGMALQSLMDGYEGWASRMGARPCTFFAQELFALALTSSLCCLPASDTKLRDILPSEGPATVFCCIAGWQCQLLKF